MGEFLAISALDALTVEADFRGFLRFFCGLSGHKADDTCGEDVRQLGDPLVGVHAIHVEKILHGRIDVRGRSKSTENSREIRNGISPPAMTHQKSLTAGMKSVRPHFKGWIKFKPVGSTVVLLPQAVAVLLRTEKPVQIPAECLKDLSLSHRVLNRLAGLRVANAMNACADFAEEYLGDLKAEAQSPSLREMSDNLAAIARTATKLSRQLAMLSPQERYVLGTRFLRETAGHDRHMERQIEVAAGLRLDAIKTSGKTHVTSRLAQISELAGEVSRLIIKRYTGAKKLRGVKALPRYSSPALWRLIDRCWTYFAEVGIKPSATVGGNLERFIRAIDEWTTGKPSELETILKTYASQRRELDRLAAEYYHFLTSANFRSDFEFRNELKLQARGQSRIRPDLLRKGQALRERQQELIFMLEHGYFGFKNGFRGETREHLS